MEESVTILRKLFLGYFLAVFVLVGCADAANPDSPNNEELTEGKADQMNNSPESLAPETDRSYVKRVAKCNLPTGESHPGGLSEVVKNKDRVPESIRQHLKEVTKTSDKSPEFYRIRRPRGRTAGYGIKQKYVEDSGLFSDRKRFVQFAFVTKANPSELILETSHQVAEGDDYIPFDERNHKFVRVCPSSPEGTTPFDTDVREDVKKVHRLAMCSMPDVFPSDNAAIEAQMRRIDTQKLPESASSKLLTTISDDRSIEPTTIDYYRLLDNGETLGYAATYSWDNGQQLGVFSIDYFEFLRKTETGDYEMVYQNSYETTADTIQDPFEDWCPAI